MSKRQSKSKSPQKTNTGPPDGPSQTKLTSFFTNSSESLISLKLSKERKEETKDPKRAILSEELCLDEVHDSVLCPICSKSLDSWTLEVRNTHVNQCIGIYEAEEANTSTSASTSTIGTCTINTNTSTAIKKETSESTVEVDVNSVLVHNNQSSNRATTNTLSESKAKDKIKKHIKREAPKLSDGNGRSKKARTHTRTTTPSVDNISTDTESDSSTTAAKRSKLSARPVPFFKVLHFGGKIKVAVDAFCYGAIPDVTNYYLTHFHSDHYQGIRKNWDHGLVYCSEVTARLLQLRIGMGPEMLRPLPMNTPVVIDGLEVTLIDANHCPGAAIILFKHIETGQTMLHTGDFRASQTHVDLLHKLHPGPLDTVYLDTTYLAPSHCFPSQDEVVNTCADYCLRLKASEGKLPSTKNTIDRFFSKILPSSVTRESPEVVNPVVFVGSYVIGKEKLAVTVAKALGSKIFPYGSDKNRVLNALNDPDLNELLCDDGLACNVHIVRMSELHPLAIYNHWQVLKTKFTHLVVFSPSGWNFHASKAQIQVSEPVKFGFEDVVRHRKVTSAGKVHVINVPYSEHSSFPELRHFVRNVKAKEYIPTVNMERASQRLAMQEYLEKWTSE